MEITYSGDTPAQRDGTRFPTWFEVESDSTRYTKLFGDKDKAVYTCVNKTSKKLIGHYVATATAKKWKLKKVDLSLLDLEKLFNP